MLLSYCGLDCAECPARQAHLDDNKELREKTAKEWSVLYGADIKPEQVNCTGCLAEGVKFPHCELGCEIRKCALLKNVSNCSECVDYACTKLTSFFEFVPEAKVRLDNLLTL